MYEFSPGQRVRHRFEHWVGEVTGVVPGNGSVAWYFVRWDCDGSEDRYISACLEAE